MKSLERQLQISLAFVLMLILLGLVVLANISTRTLLESFVSSRLELDAERLLETLELNDNRAEGVTGGVRVRKGRLNPVYNIPESGHYYAIKYTSNKSVEKKIFSPSLQEKELVFLFDSEYKHNQPHISHDVSGPANQHLVVWSKAFNKGGRGIIISVAEDMSSLKENRQYFTSLFIFIGVLGFVAMLVLQRFVIRRLFTHLDDSRLEMKQIETGERQQLSEDVPTEIYPLVKEFNHSLSLMQQRMERSRNSLGNLAHALKTPLSLLIQQLDSEEVDASSAKRQAERIRQLTERELKRARLAGLGNTAQRFDPREELQTLIDVLKQAHNKNTLSVELKLADSVRKFGDREDMLELLGNLMDNAFKWANSQVSCSVFVKELMTVIIIEDDGKGKKPKELEQLAQRGIRLDESIEGHGLGLAICKDIVKLYSGSIEFGQSGKLGGFQVMIKLPISSKT